MPRTIQRTDFHQWAIDTASEIRNRQFEDINWERVAEELDDSGLSQQRELRSRLTRWI